MKPLESRLMRYRGERRCTVLSGRHATASRMVLLLGLMYLFGAWGAVLFIDVFDVAGIRSWMVDRLGMPMVWYHLFREGSPTEMLQWTSLGAVALVASRQAGWMASHRPGSTPVSREIWFFSLLAVAMLLMLIEDAGNPSHRVAAYVMSVLGDGSYLIEVAGRLPVFILIGAVSLYAFVRYWPFVGFKRPGGGLLFGGFIAYGVAAFSSVPANMLFNFYPRMGRTITETVFAGRMIPIERTLAWQLRFSAEEFTGSLFMDFAYEESIELLGAVLLLAGTCALSGHLVDRMNNERNNAFPSDRQMNSE